MSNPIPRRNILYGYPNPNTALFPEPVRSAVAPTIYDFNEIGTEWIDLTHNAIYFLTSITNGQAIWSNVTGGAATFTNLVVTGTSDLHGAVHMYSTLLVDGAATFDNTFTVAPGGGQVNIGNDAVAGQLNIGTGAASKIVILGSTYTTSSTTIQSGSVGLALTSGVGPLNISIDTANTTISIATGAAVKLVTLGSLNTSSATHIQSGTGGISLATGATTPGLIGATPDLATVASPTATATVNSRVIEATFTGFTTANGGYQTFVIASSLILATSATLVNATNLNASTNGAAVQIAGIIQAAGSLTISLLNNGLAGSGGNLGAGDNVIITVWILN